MTTSTHSIVNVPTSIISGFLGVGKTTAIHNLLSQKPKNERWGVLINEFGEVGVDASLLETGTINEKEIFLREVPGGCMCCTNGLPMQMALNQLLSRARPHRLLIEPTGLGHLEEVIATLSSGFNQKTIRLNAVITLVDARMLNREPYLTNDTFIQQIECADLIIGNKYDLYEPLDKERLLSFASQRCDPSTEVIFSERGVFDLKLLDSPSRFIEQCSPAYDHLHQAEMQLNALPFPESGYVTESNAGNGFVSSGFRFDSRFLFDVAQLRLMLHGIDVERFKGIFRTNDGGKVLNLASGVLTELSVPYCEESRCEAIGRELPNDFAAKLFDTLASTESQ
ncbi:MAG: GTP-binding protein [Litorivicinaceae bacterium]|nr:MAG: GTP-binding protein [Litorivicinaceae bacterium]CAI8402855.1 MAG: Zinc-binding GTPase YeiR [Gammaproteobacteria bacterium]